MSFICENENEDVLRWLASNRKFIKLILDLGVGASFIWEVMNQGFHMKDIQQALEINLLNIENKDWLKNCVRKGDCTFLYPAAPPRLSEKGV
jgi:hypothetical protein